jgi:hypothetical protein
MELPEFRRNDAVVLPEGIIERRFRVETAEDRNGKRSDVCPGLMCAKKTNARARQICANVKCGIKA